jgi:hypothetical protein
MVTLTPACLCVSPLSKTPVELFSSRPSPRQQYHWLRAAAAGSCSRSALLPHGSTCLLFSLVCVCVGGGRIKRSGKKGQSERKRAQSFSGALLKFRGGLKKKLSLFFPLFSPSFDHPLIERVRLVCSYQVLSISHVYPASRSGAGMSVCECVVQLNKR